MLKQQVTHPLYVLLIVCVCVQCCLCVFLFVLTFVKTLIQQYNGANAYNVLLNSWVCVCVGDINVCVYVSTVEVEMMAAALDVGDTLWISP